MPQCVNEDKNQQFFRQIDVFTIEVTEELISRKKNRGVNFPFFHTERKILKFPHCVYVPPKPDH